MSSVIFSNAQRIIAVILQFLQSSGQTKTNNFLLDSFSSGIDNATSSGEGFLVSPGTNNTSSTPTVNITLGGIAYDVSGNRIYISPSDVTLYNPANITATTNDGLGNFISTPQSTGVVNIPVTQFSQNYIWIDYLPTIDTSAFTLNEITDAKIFFKQTDGYNVTVTTVNVPPDANSIFLASVNMIGGGAVTSSNISQVGRTYMSIDPKMVPVTTPFSNGSNRTSDYAQNTTYTLDAHIKSIGTGSGISPFNPHNMSLADLGVSQFDTVQAHRQLEHGDIYVNTGGNAIIAGSSATPYPVTSAMATSINVVNPGSDYITVHQLLSTEYAIINGTAYNVNSIFGAVPTNASVFFPPSSGFYNVYWDGNAKVFGVTTGDISLDSTKIWLCGVTYTYVGSGPSDHNSLSTLLDRRRIGSTLEKMSRWVTTARPPSPISGEFGFNASINSPEYFDGNVWQSFSVPTGTILDFAGNSIPVGFLNCDGSAVSRTTYANLFTAIGTIWGPGDGSTTFNIPDFRRRVAMGNGGTPISPDAPVAAVGSVGGEELHTLVSLEVPATSVTVTITDPTHHHNSNYPNWADLGGHDGGQNYGVDSGSATTNVTSSSATGITASGSVNGGGLGHNNVQPSAVVYKVIKF